MNKEVENFLRRIANGYTELSHDKVFGEYIWFKKKAKELLDKHYIESKKI